MLRKIVVFDTGWGGEMFADFLETELQIVEVIRVIDWRHAPYCERNKGEIRDLTEAALLRYIGEVDVIVLASNIATAVALKYLRQKYPRQVFVGMMWPTLRNKGMKNILVLTTKLVRRSKEFKSVKQRWNWATVTVCECDEWIRKIDDDEMTDEIIWRDLKRFRRLKPEVVVIACTHVMDEKERLEEFFGWRTWVTDENTATLKNLCRAMKLRGGNIEYERS